MIKVNLLGEQTIRVRPTTVKTAISRESLAIAAIFVVLVGGMGGWWYSIHRQVQSLTDSRDRLKLESTRLQALKKEADQFEKLKKARQSRVEVIQRLKEFQTGPVLLLNHLIQSMPTDSAMWLTLLDQKSDRIQIVGFVERPEAVPLFMNNLSASGFFKSVDLELLENDKEYAKFSLICTSSSKQMPE